MRFFLCLAVFLVIASPAFSEVVAQEDNPGQVWIESYRANLEGDQRDYFDGILLVTNSCLAVTLSDIHSAAGSFSAMVAQGHSVEDITTDLVAICYKASKATLKKPAEMQPLLEDIHKNQLLPFALHVVRSMVAKGQ